MEKIFEQFNKSRNFSEVFNDFLVVSCIAISNAINWKTNREREYIRVMEKYSKREQLLFPKILGKLTIELEKSPRDILGELYMVMNQSNNKIGQFFTPYSVSKLTARLSYDEEAIKEGIEKYGYITLNEPTCGSGGMVIAFAEVMKEKGYNYQNNLKVVCQDIDKRCVMMSYLQLSILGINAIVLNSNTLTLEVFDKWITPMYFLIR